MKPARKDAADLPVDKLAADVDCLAIYLADMTAMRAEVSRLMAVIARQDAGAAPNGAPPPDAPASPDDTAAAATIARLETDNVLLRVAITAERLVDYNTAGTTPKWLYAERAGFRFGLGAERMRQIEGEGGTFVTRRIRHRIQFLTSSIDACLRSIGRKPNLTRAEQAAEAKAKAKATL